MTASGWGMAVLGAGIALALLLMAGPAMSIPLWRRPNRRGHPVTVLPGLFPAVAIALVGGLRVLTNPESAVGPVLVTATAFAAGGLLADLSGGTVSARRGFDIPALAWLWEAGAAVVVAAQIRGDVSGTLTAALVIVAVAVAWRAPWPPGVGLAGGSVALITLAATSGAGSVAMAALPAAGAAAALLPLDFRGRLVAGRAAQGTLGASVGLLLAARATPPVHLGLAAIAAAVAGAAALVQRLRRRTAIRT